MKKTTFIINSNNTSANGNNACTFCKSADYSKILDNIIADHIIATNPYLTPTKDEIEIDNIINASKKHYIIIDGSNLKSDKFAKAANFLANYKKNKNTIKSKFIFGKTYKLNGYNITFYDDEIQIGSNLFSYSDFSDALFLKKLPSPIQKTIININIYLNN